MLYPLKGLASMLRKHPARAQIFMNSFAKSPAMNYEARAEFTAVA